mmetsp:Transcript_34497/g.116965  ORF Transcript_34497/g.116965 Transcript_34497/m.116965 type:complete len:226 (+) Transcript_34497:27-704(+)
MRARTAAGGKRGSRRARVYDFLLLDDGDGLLRRVVEVVGGRDVEAALVDDLLAELDVRALEAHDQGDLEADLLDAGDDALGDDVALHDAAEDVDEERLDVRVRRDDLEGLDDLLLRRAPADVEEVRGTAAVHLDDVHGRHGEAGAVDHAADGPVEADVVEVPLLGGDVARVLLRLVALREDVLLAEGRVVVEADLRVRGDERALVVLGEGVHLDHGAVAAFEDLV